MPDSLLIQLGSEGPIPLATFQSALKLLLHMLRNVDSALSESRVGTTTWEVVSLRKASPAVVGITGVPRDGFGDIDSRAAQRALITGTSALEMAPERPREFSDAFLKELGSLARTGLRLGGLSLEYSQGGLEPIAVQLTQRTAAHVRELLAPKQVAYGSVDGALDAINVHGQKKEFRIWELKSSSPVSCKFAPEMFHSVTEALQGMVRVHGRLFLNAAARPIKIEAARIESLGDRSVPTIDEMSGLVDLTGGRGLRAFVKDLQHDWD